MIVIVLVLIATLLGSGGAILLKKGSDKLCLNFRKMLKNYYLFGGVFLYVTSAVFFILALSKGELSFVYPIVATSYIWASLLSVKFLDEKMNKFKWIGICIIIIGVTLIGLGS